MATLESLIENPEEWEVPVPAEKRTAAYMAKLVERRNIFNAMKALQLQKLNRYTFIHS